MKKTPLLLAFLWNFTASHACLTPINDNNQSLCSTAHRIDKRLGSHYQLQGKNDYFDESGNGKFLNYFIENQFEEDCLEDELGEDAKSELCELLEFDDDFPHSANYVTEKKKREEIFNLLKFAYNAAKMNASTQAKQIEIIIQLTQTLEKIPLKCTPNNTIGDIKRLIEGTEYFTKEAKKLDYGRMRLIVNGTNPEDNMKISDFNIKEGSLLYLVMGSRKHYGDFEFQKNIIVRTLNKELYAVPFKEGATVSYIKNEIMKKSGKPVNEQIFVYAGKVLHCDSVLKKRGDIPPGAGLHLLDKKEIALDITCKPKGWTYASKFAQDKKIKDVKKEIMRSYGIAIEKQILLRGIEKLSNDSFINDDFSSAIGAKLQLLTDDIDTYRFIIEVFIREFNGRKEVPMCIIDCALAFKGKWKLH